MKQGRPKEDLFKVRILLPDGEWHRGEAEWVWAEKLGEDTAIVRNVPFFAKGLSFGDSIRFSTADGVPTFSEVLSRAGHSTYRIFASHGKDDPQVQGLLRTLNEHHCDIEIANARLIAVDVLPEADIYQVFGILENAEKEGYIDFQEGHCGHQVRS